MERQTEGFEKAPSPVVAAVPGCPAVEGCCYNEAWANTEASTREGREDFPYERNRVLRF